ncbi:MAG: TSUP family transporter [Alphaproteobacteria bacterium]
MARKALLGFGSGAAIGTLGGLIGLGGAEFRLPVLVGLLGMTPRGAVPMNLVISLATLAAALLGRGASLSLEPLLQLWPAILGLVAGGVASALWGAGVLSRLSDRRLSAVLALLLAAIGLLLMIDAFLPDQAEGLAPVRTAAQFAVAAAFGLAIGAVAALLGVAGGELLIPTLIFVFGANVVTAGTASILVSLILVPAALWRYGRLSMLPKKTDMQAIALPMGAGSVLGAVVGGLAVGIVPPFLLKMILGLVLIVSSIKVFARRH